MYQAAKCVGVSPPFFVAYRSLAPPLRCCLFALPLAFGALGFLLQILL